MLHDKDRIFTNLYGQDDWSLAGARRRGVWDNTKALLELGRDSIIQQIQDSGLRGRGGVGFPAGLKWSFLPKERGKRPAYLGVTRAEGKTGSGQGRGTKRTSQHPH